MLMRARRDHLLLLLHTTVVQRPVNSPPLRSTTNTRIVHVAMAPVPHALHTLPHTLDTLTP